MPIIKSAVKRMRQTATRRSRNVHTKRDLRAALKAFDAALADPKGKNAPEALNEAFSKLDTAVKKNVIHKNAAARQKSQLAAKAKAAGVKQTGASKPAVKKTAASTTAKKTATKPKSTTEKETATPKKSTTPKA
ncbi:MAG TPA: 30S ribosomal protein S20 [Candidatus Saccharimonadales bacterium]|nr:30S ribosomal protein S20 [Candidatus Saccharimonadales bacterium]